MKRLKRYLRVMALISAMLLAAAGVGVFGAILPNNTRHRYQDTTITIEMVDATDNQDEEMEQNDLE